MPGPAPQERKHGRTPNSLTAGEWREYEDVPFAGAPPMPKPPGRRRAWHPMAEEIWTIGSTMPHCRDWRADDWYALRVLMLEVEKYYTAPSLRLQTTAQITEIRRQKIALGMGEAGRKELKIRYKQRVEPGLPGNGPDGVVEVVDDSLKPAGNVVPLRDRRAAITGRGAGGGQAAVATDTATG